jgi:hypothetical protein
VIFAWLGLLTRARYSGRRVVITSQDMGTHRVCNVGFCLLGAIGPLAAQTVWNVTSPLGIQPAIAAASPGDILVLTASGGLPDYAPFTLDKGLTIRGNGAKVGYSPGWPGGTPFAIDIQVPAGQVAHLVEVDCSYGYSPFGSLGCSIVVQGGSARFEQCTMRRGNGTALSIAQSDVVVVGGSITGFNNVGAGPGLSANQSRVTLRDVAVTGASATCQPVVGCAQPSPAQPAARLTDTTLHAERTTFVGGNHNAGFSDVPAPGIAASNSPLWLAGCTVTGGSSASIGATALVNTGTITAELRNTTLIGGTPGGASSSGPLVTAPLLQLTQSSPWLRGAVTTLAFQGEPATVFGLWLAPEPGGTVTPPVPEPLYVLGGAPVVVGLLDSSGAASLPITVPNVLSLQHVPQWIQAVQVTLPGFAVRASTIAGGIIR